MVVRVRGLQSAAHLNDLQGICTGFDETKGRWLVQLENGETKALKPDNVLPVLGTSGPDVVLEGGRVVHVPLGRVSLLNTKETEDGEILRVVFQRDLDMFCQLHEVQAELNIVEGWPQCTVVLRGEPEALKKVRPELGELLKYHGLVQEAGKSTSNEDEEGKGIQVPKRYGGSGQVGGDRPSSSAEAEQAGDQIEENIEVDGMEIKSMPARNRRKR